MLRQNADGTRFAAGAGEEVAPAAGRRRDKRGSRWTQLPAHDQWEAWQHDLASRPQPADLAQLARSPGTHPLRWAVPDDYDARPAPRLLKRLTRYATRKKLPAGVVQSLGDWLNTAVAARSDAGWALESIAWCHLLPRLATSIAEPLWRALYETLFEAIGSAADSAVYDEPVRHQLLNAELPLTLAFVLPELQPCRELVLPASSALSFGLVELLDGEGLVCAAHVEHFRGLLACWTRCALLDDAAHWGSFDDDARAQFACLARQALRLTRPDGTLVLSRGTSGQWCPELIQAAVARGSRKDRRLAKRVLPDKDAPKDDRPAHKLPPPSVYSEWGEVCVMRTAWWRKCPQFACLFGGQRLRLRWVAGEEPEGLHIEYKAGWRPLCPQRGIPPGRHGVVAAVDLHQVELAGIVIQARLRRLRCSRVEGPCPYEAGISPGTGADAYPCRHERCLPGAAERLRHRDVKLELPGAFLSAVPWAAVAEGHGAYPFIPCLERPLLQSRGARHGNGGRKRRARPLCEDGWL